MGRGRGAPLGRARRDTRLGREPGPPRRFVVKIVFLWVTNRANMLYLAARTHNRAAVLVCVHAAHIAALPAFWIDWLPGNTVLTTNPRAQA